MVFTKLFAPSPPLPTFTPASLIDLSSKVYIVTSCATPSNASLACILYTLHATVYMGTSSLSESNNIASQFRKESLDSKGHLKPFIYDVADLHSIEAAVQAFLREEWRLDVLFLDTAAESVVSCFLLAKLLRPVMHTTASHFCHANPSIRVIWIADSTSSGVHGGKTVGELYPLAQEFAHRGLSDADEQPHANTLPNRNPDGVQHVVVDRTLSDSRISRVILNWMPRFVQGTQYMAYTLLYAGLGPDVRSGDLIIPWGRKGSVPADVIMCTEYKDGEGKIHNQILYGRCEENVKPLV
jgi:retinol dehydrogenase-12